MTDARTLVKDQVSGWKQAERVHGQRVMGGACSDWFWKLKIAAEWSQSFADLGLLRPDIQTQFRTSIKKAVFTELLNWPVAHWGDIGHWAWGQFDWVTSVSSSKGCADMLAWLIIPSPRTVGHKQCWDFSAEYLSPRLMNIHCCPQETRLVTPDLPRNFLFWSELPIFYLDPSANL